MLKRLRLMRNTYKLLKQCENGLKGNYFLYPKDITYAVTNKCNSYCIMCIYLEKDYQNRTYHNDKPFNVTLEQFKSFMPEFSFNSIEKKENTVSSLFNKMFNYQKVEKIMNSQIERLSIVGG